MSEVTRMLEAIEQGDSKAAEELLPLVYDELRKLAAHKMAGEAPGQTLQPTALVHEAWLRLAGNEGARFANRAHFIAAAAEAMRRILIERARSKNRLRRGGDWRRVELEHVTMALKDADETVLAVHEALDRLASRDPLKAQIVKFFAKTNPFISGAVASAMQPYQRWNCQKSSSFWLANSACMTESGWKRAR